VIGIAPPAAGVIRLAGENTAGFPSAEIARRGIGYVPQGRGLFAGMTVADNLTLGRLKRMTGSGIHWTTSASLVFPAPDRSLAFAGGLSFGGEQQMLAVARALAGDVRVLLLDEPFEGLSPAVTEELFEAFDRLRYDVAIVIVDHHLDLALALSDRTVVLERGAVTWTGPSHALRDDLALRERCCGCEQARRRGRSRLIGRSWAIVFAAGGFEVALHDISRDVVDPRACSLGREAARSCRARPPRRSASRGRARARRRRPSPMHSLAPPSSRRISQSASRASARSFPSSTDSPHPKRFLASSTSMIVASLFTENLKGRHRCLVAHSRQPAGHLVPLVEARGRTLDGACDHRQSQGNLCGRRPGAILVKREIEGFILNRLQAVLLSEAFRLVGDGYVTPQDWTRR
jgi:ABC-type branched-subunit amino acid transport system ATPase component